MPGTLKMNSPFQIEKPIHEYPLYRGEQRAALIEVRPLTLEWMEKNIKLVSPGYIFPGQFKARPWQREPMNAWHYWDTVLAAMAVQVGKSLTFADAPMYYAMSVEGINGMVAYSESDTVQSVFNLRFRDMIQKNEVLRQCWSGNEDDLTTSNLKLNNCLWRIASAQNRNDLASFSAALCIGSEVAKWRKMKTYNPILMFRGRSGAYQSTSQVKMILESSPFEIGDYLYIESHKSGCLVVRPHYKCPHCGCWQEWVDSQIKLRKIDGKEPDHLPERIRDQGEKSVFYECIGCKQEITETQRAGIDEAIIWAAPKIDEEDFKQDAEKILDDGTIPGRLEGGKRKGFDSIIYQGSRLLDISYQFYKCLALFFESKNDPEAKRTYETETMARWPKRQSRKVEVSYLESKKVKGFYQWGEEHKIPDDVMVLTFGCDTHDDGFYYTIFGWGYMMSCWLIRHDFIECKIDANKNPQQVYAIFKESLHIEPLRWSDGTEADWRYGLIDRGGHRPNDVDYISKHMNNVKAYIGLAQYDTKKPSIYKSEKDEWYLGQPQMLSDFTGTLLGGQMMYFPWDTGADFFDQIWRQFFETRLTSEGVKKEVWIHGYAGDGKASSADESGTGDDHMRDCFNLAYAALKISKLDIALFNENHCKIIKEKKTHLILPEMIKENKQQPQQVQQRVDPRRMQSRGGYFNRAYGRGRR
jgi:phage terminase large subunit GpA-like protein